MRALPQPWRFILIAAAGLALMTKLVIAAFTIGTNDVLSWHRFLVTMQHFGGLQLYYRDRLFNHPPFMLHVLSLMAILSRSSGLPFSFWLRVPAIMADVISLGLVTELLATQQDTQISPVALTLFAAAPASILISGFHGNTDPVMICFLLCTIWLLEHRGNVWLAGIAFGMSMNIKIVPVIFLPVLLLSLATFRQRLIFLGMAALTFIGGGLPYSLQDPLSIGHQIFSYDSVYGFWGLSRLATILAGTGWWPGQLLNYDYHRFGKYIVLAILGIEAIWLHRRRARLSLFRQCGITAFTFLALAPGFGNQYLAWLVPWVAGATLPALVFHGASGLLLWASYNAWAKSWPWFLAVSFDPHGYLLVVLFVCWLAVVAVALLLMPWTRRNKPAVVRHATTPLQT